MTQKPVKHYLDLETIARLENSGVSDKVPDDITRYRFGGYDSSGTTVDRKGVMVFRKEGSVVTQYKEVGLRYKKQFPEEIKVGRSYFDQEVERLEGAVQSATQHLRHYTSTSVYLNKSSDESRLAALKEIQKRADEEDPTTYRESFGRLLGTPVVNGVKYTVDMARIQIQLSKDSSFSYYLKGTEFVVSDGSRQILAYRYFSDPRVLVTGTFEGDVRKPQNVRTELDEPTRVNLSRLFKQLYPEIEGVAFPTEKGFV